MINNRPKSTAHTHTHTHTHGRSNKIKRNKSIEMLTYVWMLKFPADAGFPLQFLEICKNKQTNRYVNTVNISLPKLERKLVLKDNIKAQRTWFELVPGQCISLLLLLLLLLFVRPLFHCALFRRYNCTIDSVSVLF